LGFAEEHSIFISFDPNYRDALIKNIDEYRQNCLDFISHANFVKLSEEEAGMIAETDLIDEAVTRILQYGPKILCVTLGEKGTLLATKEKKEMIPSVKVMQVDSTGAGDAFVGAMLYQFSKEEHLSLIHQDFEKLIHYVSFANKVGAITCTNNGAISSMPSQSEIPKLMISKC
jgi:fructokinase